MVVSHRKFCGTQPFSVPIPILTSMTDNENSGINPEVTNDVPAVDSNGSIQRNDAAYNPYLSPPPTPNYSSTPELTSSDKLAHSAEKFVNPAEKAKEVYVPRPVQPSNSLNKASLIFALLNYPLILLVSSQGLSLTLFLIFLSSLIAVVCAHVDIRNSGKHGRRASGMAVAGLCIGYISLFGFVILFGLGFFITLLYSTAS